MKYSIGIDDIDGIHDFEWNEHDSYKLLDEKHQFQPYVNWSACILNHTAILFGGRQGNDDFSNNMISIKLRQGMSELNEQLQFFTKSTCECLKKIKMLYPQHYENTLNDSKNNFLTSLKF